VKVNRTWVSFKRLTALTIEAIADSLGGKFRGFGGGSRGIDEHPSSRIGLGFAQEPLPNLLVKLDWLSVHPIFGLESGEADFGVEIKEQG
jgi:hypothetical protein